MDIQPDKLSREALIAIIEEFVTREGTEYGERPVDLATKVEQVARQIERGEVVIEFDPRTETVDLRKCP